MCWIEIYVNENNDIIIKSRGSCVENYGKSYEKILKYINYKCDYHKNQCSDTQIDFYISVVDVDVEQHNYYEQIFNLFNYLSEPNHKINVDCHNIIFRYFTHYDQSIYNFIVNNSIKNVNICMSFNIGLFLDIYNCNCITHLTLTFYDVVYEEINLLPDILSGNITIIKLKIYTQYSNIPEHIKELLKNIIDTTYINKIEYIYDYGMGNYELENIPLDQRHVPIKSNSKSAAKV